MDLKYIDIGINLMGKQFTSDRDKIVEESLEKGVGLIITGTDMRSNKDAASYLKAKHPENVWCTCGLHPHKADRWNPDYKRDFTEFIRKIKRISLPWVRQALITTVCFPRKKISKNAFPIYWNWRKKWTYPCFCMKEMQDGIS